MPRRPAAPGRTCPRARRCPGSTARTPSTGCSQGAAGGARTAARRPRSRSTSRAWGWVPSRSRRRVQRVEDVGAGDAEAARRLPVDDRLVAAHDPGVAPAPDEEARPGAAGRGSPSPPSASPAAGCPRRRRGSRRRRGAGASRPSPRRRRRCARTRAVSARSGTAPGPAADAGRRPSGPRRVDDVEHHLDARPDALDEGRLGDVVARSREVEAHGRAVRAADWRPGCGLLGEARRRIRRGLPATVGAGAGRRRQGEGRRVAAGPDRAPEARGTGSRQRRGLPGNRLAGASAKARSPAGATTIGATATTRAMATMMAARAVATTCGCRTLRPNRRSSVPTGSTRTAS